MQLIFLQQKMDVYAGSFTVIILYAIIKDIHHQYFKEGLIDRAYKWLPGGVVDSDVAVSEEMEVVLMELPQRFHKFGRGKFPTVGLCFDPGQVQYATDVIRKALYILEHVADIFDPFLPWQVMLQKRFQIELQGSDGGFQFMGEVFDEFVLQPVETRHFLAVHKNDQGAGLDAPHQDRENEDNHPGFHFKELVGIEIVAAHEGLQARADLDIPVNIKNQ